MGGVAIDDLQELESFLVTMLLHTMPDDLVGCNIERGEQWGCAMAFVVVAPGSGSFLLHRQAKLGMVQPGSVWADAIKQ